MSRKRRHSRAFPSHEDDVDDHEPIPLSNGGNHKSSYAHENGQEDIEKEPEIWDAFREEHYEAIEQLPLSLHRQFILMRELDQQAHAYNSDLLPSLREYISLRRSLASHNVPQFSESLSGDFDGGNILNGTLVVQNGRELDAKRVASGDVGATSELHSQWGSASPARGGPSTPRPVRKTYATSVATPRTPTPISIPPERAKSPHTTRELLSHIGWLSEELSHASEEKVNLAQAGCDSVDRHIRLIDQAIKEQEASISLGIRSSTHLAPILLPDLVVPRWARPSRVTLSPVPTISGEVDGESQGDIGLSRNVSHGGPTLPSSGGPEESRVQPQKKGKKGKGRWTRKKVEQEPSMDIPEHPRRGVRSLKLTVSTPAVSAVAPPNLIVEPNEPRYCYCDEVSYGEMIACDAVGCKREWFHWHCVGLNKAPSNKSNWYCQDCSAVTGQRGRRK